MKSAARNAFVSRFGRLVHEFADSQFGHLFAGGGDREAARRHMTVSTTHLLLAFRVWTYLDRLSSQR